MTQQPTRRWGILALAVVMFLVHLISNDLMGRKGGTPYMALWIYIGYLAYKGDVKTIFTWIKWVLILNVVIALGVALFADSQTLRWIGFISVEDFLFGIGIPIAIKGGLLLYLNDKRTETADPAPGTESKKAAIVTLSPAAQNVSPTTTEIKQTENEIFTKTMVNPSVAAATTISAMTTSTKLSGEPKKTKSDVTKESLMTSIKKENGKDRLYSGSNSEIVTKLEVMLDFSKRGAELKDFLQQIEDTAERDLLIERHINNSIDELIDSCKAWITKTNSPTIQVSDPNLQNQILVLWRETKQRNKTEANKLLEIVSMLGDDIDFEVLKKKFSNLPTSQVSAFQSKEEYSVSDLLKEILDQNSISGSVKLIQALGGQVDCGPNNVFTVDYLRQRFMMNETDFKNYGFYLAKDTNDLLEAFTSAKRVGAINSFYKEPSSEGALSLLRLLCAEIRQFGSYKFQVTSQRTTCVLDQDELIIFTQNLVEQLGTLVETKLKNRTA